MEEVKSVGTGTVSSKVKKLWREAAFKRENVGNKQNPNKRIYVRQSNTPSLKQFVRALAKSGDQTAKDYLALKLGKKKQKRSEANIALSKTISSASKQARNKAKK